MKKMGFTLIELLVVVGIIGLLIAVSLAGWGKFRDKKALEGMTEEIISGLREVRARAVNGEKPAGCNTLNGYRVDSNLRIASCCDSDDRTCHRVGDLEEMSNDLSMDLDSFSPSYSHFPVIFRVLSGAVDNEATIDLSYHDISGEITISESGEISWQQD